MYQSWTFAAWLSKEKSPACMNGCPVIEKKALGDQKSVSCICIYKTYGTLPEEILSIRLLSLSVKVKKLIIYAQSRSLETWQQPITTSALMKHFSQAINFRKLMSEIYTKPFVYSADSDVFAAD